MKEIFNLKRFGRFFMYDLRNSKNSFWLSLLICAAMPLICFTIAQMISRIFFGTWLYECLPVQISSVIMAFVVVMLTYPVKAYGNITDKRAGSNWIMIPASPEEKTLSIFLTSCVVLPVVFIALLTGFDALVGVLFPECWRSPLIADVFDLDRTVRMQSDGLMEVNSAAFISYCWISNILTFILGSIFFKKAKVGKTFLCLFLLGQAMSIAMSVFLIGTPSFSDLFVGNVDTFSDPSFAVRILNNFNWFVSIYCWGYLVLVIALIWARVKTIKH